MVYAQPRIYPGEWGTQTPMQFWHKNVSPNLSQTTRPYNIKKKKKDKKGTCKIGDFVGPVDHSVKLKKMKRMINTLTLPGNYKSVEHESDVYINCNWCSWYSYWRIIKETGGIGNKRTSGDRPDNYITDVGQNTEKSPGDLRILAVTQTSVKDHQLTPMWNTLKV